VLEAAAPGHVEHVRRALIDALTPEQVGQLHQISAAIAAAIRSSCATVVEACEEAEAVAADALVGGCGSAFED
jgi:hypothetical protein